MFIIFRPPTCLKGYTLDKDRDCCNLPWIVHALVFALGHIFSARSAYLYVVSNGVTGDAQADVLGEVLGEVHPNL